MSWLIYAITAAIIWGLDYTLGEKIFHERISPFTLLAIQMLFGSVIFFCIAIFQGFLTDIQTIVNDKTLFWIILAALLTFNVGNLLIFLSIQAKNATTAGLIELSYPLFTVFFSYLLFKQNHFNMSTLIGGLLIFAGVFSIYFFGKQ